jgi:hypothetical protein
MLRFQHGGAASKTESAAAGGRFPHGDCPPVHSNVHNMSSVKQLGVCFKITKLNFTDTQFQIFSRSLKPGNKPTHSSDIHKETDINYELIPTQFGFPFLCVIFTGTDSNCVSLAGDSCRRRTHN